MALLDTLKTLLGSAWHVNSDNALAAILPAVDGNAEAGKLVVLDASKNIGGITGISMTGGLLSAGPTSGIGYATGAGGAVTQASSKSTGVTLNKVTGQITMNNAALAAGVEVAFTLTNSAIAATDVVVANVATGGTSASYAAVVTAVAAGSCEITVSNLSAGSLSEALVLNFVVLKGVAA